MQIKQLSRRLALCLVAGTVLVGCTGQNAVQPKAAATPINCGKVASLVTYPSDSSWLGVRVGPLFFTGFEPSTRQAVIPDFDPKYPTKVVIQPTDPLKEPLSLQGRRCLNGERLRFKYGASWNVPVATLQPAGAADTGTPVGYGGYMLFTAAGTWEIAVTDSKNQAVGSAVFMVQAKT